MTPWVWLLGAAAAGVGAYLVGWPAWNGYRARQARDLNAERYLAWRGRADRSGDARGGPAPDERRRLWIAAVLAVLAAACLIVFFASS